MIALLILLLLAGAPMAAHAHNVATALISPLSGITVDGDLSDWPDDMQRYPIEWAVGMAPRDETDFSADSRVGYDAATQTLFFGVEIRDESLDLSAGGTWNSRDGCAEGTGLGLAIAKKTVELLGGAITATSEVGAGTTFTVRLNDS